MLLLVFLLINLNLLENFVSSKNANHSVVHTHSKYVKWEKTDKKILTPTLPKCKAMGCTQGAPFMVFVLYKTSGHFLGMGSLIDKQTVLTCLRVISFCLNHQSDMLVLAGSLSPWWGKDSQIRRVKRAVFNEYEVAILRLEIPFVFNDRIKALKMLEKKMFYYTQTYGSYYVTHGITIDSTFVPGTRIKKGIVFEMSIDPITRDFWVECNRWHASMIHSVNNSIHMCSYTYGFHCHGLLGSPVLGVDKEGHTRAIAVVISTMCLEFDRFYVSVKLPYFDHFIKANSLLGYKLRDVQVHNPYRLWPPRRTTFNWG